MAYLFSHAGAPWLTQDWVRRVRREVFGGITPHGGYNGDEDQGQMGALGVLMAIGLFDSTGGIASNPRCEIRVTKYAIFMAADGGHIAYTVKRPGGLKMTKYFALALLSCVLLFGGDKKGSSNAQAVQKCVDGCTKSYDSCKKNATSKTAIQGCEKSRDICRAACNK